MKLNIIYEDEHLLVLYKPAGVPVQSARVGAKDCESLVKNYLYEKNPGKGAPYLGIVHRLDQPVEGLVLFALTQKAAADLSRQSSERKMEKTYLAVRHVVDNRDVDIHKRQNICGKPPENVEKLVDNWTECVDFLCKNGKENRSEIVPSSRPGAKKAVLRYRVLERREGRELVEIRLETGRHHQIRVQMAGRGTPLVGDRKYGMENVENCVDNVDNLFPALCAYRLRFRHPSTGKWMEFEVKPQNPVFSTFLSTK